jgi:predicted enzyme related to lactoylglutathione lyase
MYAELQCRSTFLTIENVVSPTTPHTTMADDKKQRPDYSIDYIEIHVNAVASSKKFYGDAFGWSFQNWGPDYAAFEHANVSGGMTSGPVSASGAPLVILYASNLEEARARVEKAGGIIVRPIFSFPGGRRFHFADPAGNELAIWSDH